MHSPAYHEGKQHGTVSFPVAYYYVDEDHAQYNMPFHWHKEWEIIHIIQGEFMLHGDGEEYPAGPGDVLLIRDGMLHGGTPSSCVYECLVFDLHGLFRDFDSVKKYLRPIYRGRLLPKVFYQAGQTLIPSIAGELFQAFLPRTAGNRSSCDACPPAPEEPIPATELVVLGNISRLFAAILSEGYYTVHPGSAGDNSRKISQVKPVLEYIEVHYSMPLTLEKLAAAAGMSPKYFCRFFHSITQQTPMEYVNYYRIEQACRLLCATDMTVTAIGMECGFNDSSYFVKAFKKYKGMTPKQYQKLNI